MNKLKIYLAGPDVFKRHPVAVGEKAKALVASYGFEPLFPLDNQISPHEKDPSLAIFRANEAMIRRADVVLVNLNPFRGYEPDSGSVWEAGYACGLGKPVIGYIESGDCMLARIQAGGLASIEDDRWVDGDGLAIEDFAHPLSLMLMHSVKKLIIGSLKDAVEELAKGLELQ